MIFFAEIIEEFWTAVWHVLCCGTMAVVSFVIVTIPVWLPLSAIRYWQLEGWTALSVFAFGGLLLLFLLFAAAKAARAEQGVLV